MAKFTVVFLSVLFIVFSCIGPLALLTVSAHEVYVLTPDEVGESLREPPLPVFSIIEHNLGQFVAAGFVTLVIIVAVWFLSVTAYLQLTTGKLLSYLKPHAASIIQAGFALALLASAYFGSFFGPELPMHLAFPGSVMWSRIILATLSLCILFGVFVRAAAFLFILLYTFLVATLGFYVFNYTIYLGVALVLFMFGGYSLLHTSVLHIRMFERFRTYKFLILRVALAASLMFASLYAKFFYSALALNTVLKYHLTLYFPFQPDFIVLGALIVEFLIGLFFLLGFEIRLASLFFLVSLCTSIFFFQEAVWPHLILFGGTLAMFSYGYDRYTLGMKLSKGGREPVL